ncbi:hypothetical protein ABZ595_28110 [Streptomyces rubradiris]|uniref:hypothetical protein n=1 Tax=Streptomyces rubradiris TaxID=285531 RepID=UPI0033FA2A1D
MFGAGYCHDGGLLGTEDRTVDGAHRLYHEWALDHVPAGQAVPGLRRLRRRPADDGWKATSWTRSDVGSYDPHTAAEAVTPSVLGPGGR